MTTQFGDIYDHSTDMIVFLGIAITVMQKKRRQITLPVVAILLCVLLLFVASIRCQQKKNTTDANEILDISKSACQNEDWIKWTRFFGPTSFNIILVLLVIYLFHEKT
jgi:phosphatidylglycerophosphate synthase